MVSFILEMAGSFAVAVGGFLALMKIIVSMRARKEVWDIFKKMEERGDFQRREGTKTGYGMPDLVGKTAGREIYVHPVRSMGGKKPRPSKTVYAVESKLNIDEDIIIFSPDTSEMDEKLPILDAPRLEKYGYNVASERHKNQGIVDKLLNKEVANRVNRLIVKNGDRFRAVIIESGLVMFSTFKIENRSEKMKENIDGLVELVELMEDNYTDLEDEQDNERLKVVRKKSNFVYVDLALMGAVSALAIYIIYYHMIDLSFFFVNLGVVLFMISALRAYSISHTRGWL